MAFSRSNLPLFNQYRLFLINIKNFVTIVLTTVEIFLSCRTQFVAFLVTQQLNSFFDGNLDTLSLYILDFNGVQHPNPSYSIWLSLDQLIRSWLFATISPELLTEVHDLIHANANLGLSVTSF